MGLTDNQKEMIVAIAKNDLGLAKKCAASCIMEDTTRKNQFFCERYKSILASSGSNFIELPHDLKTILCVEDVANTFKESRYFLATEEERLLKKIIQMKRVNERFMELGISYLNTTLLYGESGTGKTTFGRYVAYKTGLPFCYINFTNLVDSYMGNTSKNISKAFSYAITNPCVFMLDEIDCISINRSDAGSSGGPSGEMARVTISLMQEFDKLPNDVIVIGATNRVDRMDAAFLRRFSVKHEVEVFDFAKNLTMIKRFVDDVGISVSDEELKKLAKIGNSQSEVLNNLISTLASKIALELTD